MARKSQRVAKPKSPVSGPQVSRAQKKFELGKTIHKEAKSVQSQIGKETEKAYERSMWSTIGATLGSLALGIATGGSSALVHGLAVAAGATVGGYGGKAIAEGHGGAKRKRIESDLFYEKEAGAQTLAFKDYDKELNTSIWQKGVMAGLLAGGVKYGGDLYKEKQLAKLGTGTATPDIVKGGDILVDAQDMGKGVDRIDIGTETDIQSNITENGIGSELENILAEGQKDYGTFESGQKKKYGAAKIGGEYATDTEIAEAMKSAEGRLAAKSITPTSDEVGKDIFGKLEKTLATAFEAGMSSKDVAKTQQSILLGGGYALSAYKPEMAKLRPVQFRTPRGLSYS